MKQSEIEWISELIRKHQKQMRSQFSLWRKDQKSIESFKMDGDKHMVEWLEARASVNRIAMRAQKEIMVELAELADIPLRDAFKDTFLHDEVKAIVVGRGIKILDIDDVQHRPHIREMLARVA
jgi:hypothetical protein